MMLENTYGNIHSMSERTVLKAGQLDLLYENGSIRWIRLGNTEILRMIYSAVRDCNWGTIEPVVLKQDIQVLDLSFEINLKVEYKADPIHFIADYRISGNQHGIRFEMNGTAQSDFMKNRIGFCILHPIRECAGKTARVIYPDGSGSEFIFPTQISAHQPVKNIQSIIWNPASEVTARLNLSGDVFEMEDQRNWTDASYKTYCTPLDLSFPAQIKKGETVSQVVELTVEATDLQQKEASDYVFSWDRISVFPIPEIGTAISSCKQTLTNQEINILKELPLKHLRVEIKMYHHDFTNALEKASHESQLLGWPLFIVLYLSENHLEEYLKFRTLCKGLNLKINYLLLVGENHLPHSAFDELATLLKVDFPDTLIGTGVNAYFAELNRSRPSVEKADFVSFTICPQVHAIDEASLVENMEAQAYAIDSAKKLFPGKPIFVSPVSLKQRFNVVATSSETEPESGKLPSSVDARQRSVFAAAWTLGSLKFLAQAGAQLITYYETVGYKGFIQGEQSPELRDLFPAEASEVFPVYEAIKKLSGYSELAHSSSSHPLIFDGLVLYSEEKIKFILFNFTIEDIEIRLEEVVLPGSTLPDSSKGKLRIKANAWVEIEW